MKETAAMEFFDGDAMPEHDEPFIKFSKWESEIYDERGISHA